MICGDLHSSDLLYLFIWLVVHATFRIHDMHWFYSFKHRLSKLKTRVTGVASTMISVVYRGQIKMDLDKRGWGCGEHTEWVQMKVWWYPLKENKRKIFLGIMSFIWHRNIIFFPWSYFFIYPLRMFPVCGTVTHFVGRKPVRAEKRDPAPSAVCDQTLTYSWTGS